MKGLSILLPSIGRNEQLAQLLNTIRDDATLNNAEIVVVLDNRENFVYDWYSPSFKVIKTNRIGYWRCLNLALDHAKYEHILWTADDIKPHEGWLDIGISCFKAKFPDGLGVVGLNDVIVRDAACGHGISTKRFLEVLFGSPAFPNHFEHLFLDTMIADRAKSIDCFYFCENAITEHMHYSVGKSEIDTTNKINQARSRFGIGDKKRKEAMDVEWLAGGKEEALARLEKMRNE